MFRQRIKFYIHTTIYITVNLALLVINLMAHRDYFWSFGVLLCWGIVLAIHYATIKASFDELEGKKLQNELEK